MEEWRYNSTILDFWCRRVVSFTHRQLYSRRRSQGTHWIGDSLGRRAGQYFVEKTKLWCPSRAVQPVGCRYTDCVIPAIHALLT
jgi:hypothetical protein